MEVGRKLSVLWHMTPLSALPTRRLAGMQKDEPLQGGVQVSGETAADPETTEKWSGQSMMSGRMMGPSWQYKANMT